LKEMFGTFKIISEEIGQNRTEIESCFRTLDGIKTTVTTVNQ